MHARTLIVCAALLGAACGSTASPAASTSPSPSGTIVVAEVGKTVMGQTEAVLTTTNGVTLYYLTSDTATTVACSGQCATFWPPLLLPSGQPAAAVSLPGKLTVASTANGMQVEYNGHPLYAFVKDKTGDATSGEGVKAFGGTWHVVTPNLSAM